jgi:Cell division protein CrgA
MTLDAVAPSGDAVPKSTVRKKKVYTPPAELRPQSTAAAKKPSPTWLPVTAVCLIVFGILWLVVYYLTGQFFDLGESFLFLARLQYWNLAIGFTAMVAALVLLARWR